jgi:hypothetical protein
MPIAISHIDKPLHERINYPVPNHWKRNRHHLVYPVNPAIRTNESLANRENFRHRYRRICSINTIHFDSLLNQLTNHVLPFFPKHTRTFSFSNYFIFFISLYTSGWASIIIWRDGSYSCKAVVSMIHIPNPTFKTRLYFWLQVSF